MSCGSSAARATGGGTAAALETARAPQTPCGGRSHKELRTKQQVKIAVEVAKAAWPRTPPPAWANIYLAFFNVRQW